jgi:hypothetical protein
VLGEVRRLRGQLADMTAERDQFARQLADLIEATDYDLAAYWRTLAARAAEQAAAVAYEEGIERGRQLQAAELERLWHIAADPIARGGAKRAELELRRWGPGGREHFGDPRPGDRKGGPVVVAGE